MTGLGGSPGSSAPQSFKALLSEGNTIRRNLAKVPKDQQKLLDRPDSWFTSHKDTNGPPNLPAGVLESLREFHAARPCIASTYAADSHQSFQAPQVVHDTPGAPRTLARVPEVEYFLASQAGPSGSKSGTDLPAATITDEQRATIAEERDPMIMEEDAEKETIGMKKPVLRVSMDDPMRWKKADDKRELIQWLNDNWVESDWLPPPLQEYRSTLSFSSLKTLQNITKLAIDGGIDLLSLWAEPDGCLYRTISRQSNGKLSFPEDLNHEALEPLAKASRLARERRAARIDPIAPRRQPTVEPSAVAAPVRDEAAVENAENGSNMLPDFAESSHPPREETLEWFSQQPAKAFQNAYPSFTGSVADFVRACIVVKGLQRKHQLPKWLYDDFIRAFVDGYTSYMDEVDKSSSIAKPMSAIRWYVANVDRPVYQKDVVTADNLDRIFEIYSEEVGEAKKWLLDGISSSPIVLETPQRPAVNVSMPSKHASPTLPVASIPKDDTMEPPNASGTMALCSPAEGLRSPREVQAASEVVRAPMIREQPDSRDEASLPKPKLNPSRQDKDKQRMADEEPPRRVSPITPTLRRQKSPASADDDLVFVSSHPRSRPASVQAASTEKIIKHESPTVHRASPLDRSTPQKVPAINQANGTLSERRRTGTIAETPPPAPKTAAAFPGNKVTSGAGKTAVRRTLPASFDFGPPSRPAVSSPARSTLSASTQDARVKKPKKTEKEKQEAYRRKIAKLFKQGRLPGSTPAPKGGDA
ncbi:hypothetical protein GCG54_00000067 [Colletotrichum gloeosporioides]|uniref:Uncharacterized protein n=1 Tax=Colletotrichum gloeosporioides TaxID=474922 RepID=A0A8H4CMU9_COLGL|nr:uncharacterized protein GCG54_00000067 [Colletotrichum gloeosporioides]KAF3806701.1 hypothetical protein GCG54_00000067 [Colletotrichum gloeosporioides]